MELTRIISLALRVAQFLCATIVLGTTAYFLHEQEAHHTSPLSRLIYSVVIAATSILLALLWLALPHTSLVHCATDLLFCAAWFAVFGLLQDYYDDAMQCGSAWAWGNSWLTGSYCGLWNAAQAFAFLAAVFWFASFIVGLLAWSKGRPVVVTDGVAVKRGFFRRSAV